MAVQAASPAVALPSPGSKLTSPSPRRTSRRDADLGLPTTAPAESPSPRHEPNQATGGTVGRSAAVPAQAVSPTSAASQPYYASPDEGADCIMSEDDDDEEISLAGTPEVCVWHNHSAMLVLPVVCAAFFDNLAVLFVQSKQPFAQLVLKVIAGQTISGRIGVTQKRFTTKIVVTISSMM